MQFDTLSYVQQNLLRLHRALYLTYPTMRADLEEPIIRILGNIAKCRTRGVGSITQKALNILKMQDNQYYHNVIEEKLTKSHWLKFVKLEQSVDDIATTPDEGKMLETEIAFIEALYFVKFILTTSRVT